MKIRFLVVHKKTVKISSNKNARRRSVEVLFTNTETWRTENNLFSSFDHQSLPELVFPSVLFISALVFEETIDQSPPILVNDLKRFETLKSQILWNVKKVFIPFWLGFYLFLGII